MPNEKEVKFTIAQQEAFAKMVRTRLDELGWTRAEAAERAGVGYTTLSTLTRTAPSGTAFGYFLKVCLALDIDIYQVCELLGLDREVKQAMADPKTQNKYPNARKYFARQSPVSDPMDALLAEIAPEKRANARRTIESIINNV